MPDSEVSFTFLREVDPTKRVLRWDRLIVRNLDSLIPTDPDFFNELRLPTSRRLYLFLDRRFQVSGWWTFDVAEFGREKMGMSSDYRKTSKFKYLLSQAIDELEKKGFLKTLPQEERFVKFGVGRYEVHFAAKK